MTFRLEPMGSPQQYRSHSWRAPVSTHWRTVSCAQADCEAWQNGWTTRVDVSTDLGQRQARYITEHSRRRFHETPGIETTLREFTFPPGQTCFREHREQIKPGLFVLRDGDWRGNPSGRSQRVSERTWVDDLGEQTERLTEIRRREGM